MSKEELMRRIAMFSILLLSCVAVNAQAPAVPELKRTRVQEKTKNDEEIKILRGASKPLLELKKRHGADMSALKRAHVTEKKQLIERLSGADAAVRNKAVSELMKKHREAFRKARKKNKAELDEFIKDNPEAEKAYKELLYSGIRVGEAPQAPNESGK